MSYKYNSIRKWKREGFKSLLQILILIFFSFFSSFSSGIGDQTNLFFLAFLLLVVMERVYNAIYYFTLHNKDYLIIESSSISIYKGKLFPKKYIEYHKVKHVVQVSDIIILKLHDGKEEEIYTERLSHSDTNEVKKELKHRLGQKAVTL
ncbi:hypothetical protein [Bacillus sp. AK128]